MMNKLTSAIFVSLRGYHGRGRGGPRGSRSRVSKPRLTEEQLYPDSHDYDEANDDDFDDTEKNEADFMGANQTYGEHMREERFGKAKLKMQIIARKYFKSEDPNFITWTEKMEIQSLHDKDRVEWSPERLSESFPALPDTIRRILRAKWQPKNTTTVLKYDEKVIDNWNKFKSGNIAVSPKLEAHLQQFKGRKIEAADLETIAKKFVKPKPVFPEPKASLFTSIVRNFVEPPETAKNLPRISDGKQTDKINFSQLKIRDNKRINYDTFMKTTVNKISNTENLSLGVQLLVDEYKKMKNEEILEDLETLKPEIEVKKMENPAKIVSFEAREDAQIQMNDKNRQELPEIGEKNSENAKKIVSFEEEKKIVTREESNRESQLELANEKMKGVAQVKPHEKRVIFVDVPKLNIEQDNLATGIIEWKKKEVSGAEDYPKFIKIPQHKAQKQITFRVEDRYYDCDGEFLYRVPGLKSM